MRFQCVMGPVPLEVQEELGWGGAGAQQGFPRPEQPAPEQGWGKR